MNPQKLFKGFLGTALLLFLVIPAGVSFGEVKEEATVEDHLQKIVDKYVLIQAELSADSVENVIRNASLIKANADSAIELETKREEKEETLIETLNDIRTSAESFNVEKLGITEARKNFSPLSDAVIRLVRHHLPGEQANKYAFFYCSMAKGYWMQAGDETRNPYYGSEMLKCGKKIDPAKICPGCKGECKCGKHKDDCLKCPSKPGEESGKNGRGHMIAQ